jgi:hypothetical protein
VFWRPKVIIILPIEKSHVESLIKEKIHKLVEGVFPRAPPVKIEAGQT